jgi:hypothetical protein
MEIATSVIEFGCIVWGGFVRDVYIRKEPKFNDIDIVCQLHRREEFLEFLKEKWGGQVVKSKEASKMKCALYIVPNCKFFDEVHVNGTRLEIMYHEKFEDWGCKESTVDFTNCLFCLTKDGLGLQYLPEGYTRGELLQLVLDKKFKYIKEGFRTKTNMWLSLERSKKFQSRGWRLVF